MKVTPRKLTFPLAMTDPHRGKGLHASDIYGDYYKQLYPKKYNNPKNNDPFVQDLLFAIGLAWEQYFEKVLKANGELVDRPGELESDDGVKYSPDLLIVNGQDRIGEIKATYMSTNNCVPGKRDFEKYLSQGMLYCYWSGIPRIRYYVLHLHGDWRGKLIDFKCYDIEFTKRDLIEEHRKMMKHAKDEGMCR